MTLVSRWRGVHREYCLAHFQPGEESPAKGVALALAEGGAKILVADVDEDGGPQSVKMAGARDGSAAFRRCDVTKTEDLGSTFDSAVEYFGSTAATVISTTTPPMTVTSSTPTAKELWETSS